MRPINESERKEYERRLRKYNKETFKYLLNIPKPEVINDSVLINGNEIWVRKIRVIPSNVLILWIQDKDSSLRVTYDNDVIPKKYFFPLGALPVFDTTIFQNSTFIYKSGNIYSRIGLPFSFIVNNKYRLSFDNIVQNILFESFNKSSGIFYDKERSQEITKFLTSLKTRKLIIDYNGEIYKEPEILKAQYDGQTLSFIMQNANGEELTLKFDGRKKDGEEKFIFDLPIYDLDCHNQVMSEFYDIKLNSDYIINPTLKKTLLNALESSPEWMNFKIEKVILTNKSQWMFVLNKYTRLRESRFMFADVYFTSTIDNKCYFQKDVYFSQAADPIDGFIYSIFVSVPQLSQQYPCNLK